MLLSAGVYPSPLFSSPRHRRNGRSEGIDEGEDDDTSSPHRYEPRCRRKKGGGGTAEEWSGRYCSSKQFKL